MFFDNIPKPLQIAGIGIIVVALPLTVLLAQQKQSVNTNAQGTAPAANPAAGAAAQPATGAVQPGGPVAPQNPCGKQLLIQQGLSSSKNPPAPISLPNPICLSGTAGASGLANWAVTVLLIATALISFIMLIWGGVQYILSGGDPKGIEGARKRITFAIIGIVVSFSAIVIINMLGKFFGFTL